MVVGDQGLFIRKVFFWIFCSIRLKKGSKFEKFGRGLKRLSNLMVVKKEIKILDKWKKWIISGGKFRLFFRS